MTSAWVPRTGPKRQVDLATHTGAVNACCHSIVDTSTPATLVDDVFLRELIDGIGLDAVIEAMGYFQEEASTRAMAIDRAFTAGTIPTLRREVHALAGSARAVGLLALGEAAYGLQTLTESVGPDERRVQGLLALMERTMAALTDWIARHDPAPVAPDLAPTALGQPGSDPVPVLPKPP